MKLLIILMLLVCGQTMAQKYNVPVSINMKNTDTVKILLFSLNKTADTIAEIQYECCTYFKYAQYNKYEAFLKEKSSYLILFIFPDNSQIELFVDTGKEIDSLKIEVDKKATIIKHIYYDGLSYKYNPINKRSYFALASKFSW